MLMREVLGVTGSLYGCHRLVSPSEASGKVDGQPAGCMLLASGVPANLKPY